jgi:hypothetical protein
MIEYKLEAVVERAREMLRERELFAIYTLDRGIRLRIYTFSPPIAKTTELRTQKCSNVWKNININQHVGFGPTGRSNTTNRQHLTFGPLVLSTKMLGKTPNVAVPNFNMVFYSLSSYALCLFKDQIVIVGIMFCGEKKAQFSLHGVN